eukprot:8670055-Pyramimonas_sp.AAC.1
MATKGGDAQQVKEAGVGGSTVQQRKRKSPEFPASLIADEDNDAVNLDTIASWASDAGLDAAVRDKASRLMTQYMDKVSQKLGSESIPIGLVEGSSPQTWSASWDVCAVMMFARIPFAGHTGTSRWKGKVAVVTGATSGIGMAISVKLAVAGVIVIGTGRREGRLEELRQDIAALGGVFHGEVVDSRNTDSITQLFAK